MYSKKGNTAYSTPHELLHYVCNVSIHAHNKKGLKKTGFLNLGRRWGGPTKNMLTKCIVYELLVKIKKWF